MFITENVSCKFSVENTIFISDFEKYNLTSVVRCLSVKVSEEIILFCEHRKRRMKYSFYKWRTDTGIVRQVGPPLILRIRLQQNGGGLWRSLGCPSAKKARFQPTDAAHSADVISQLKNTISPAQRKHSFSDTASRCKIFNIFIFLWLFCTVANFLVEVQVTFIVGSAILATISPTCDIYGN